MKGGGGEVAGDGFLLDEDVGGRDVGVDEAVGGVHVGGVLELDEGFGRFDAEDA